MGIDDELNQWKEETGAGTEESAPEQPCLACSTPMPEEDKRKIKNILFNTAYHSLKQEGGRIILITDDGCRPCDEAQEILNPFIQQGAIEVMPFKKCSPEDKACIARRGINVVPVLVSRNQEGEFGKLFPLSGKIDAVPIPVPEEQLTEEE